MPDRRFDVSIDGVSIHVLQWDGMDPPCLLLHGTGEGGYVWEAFARSLQPQCRVLAPDLRGHGDSSWDPNGNYDAETSVADVMRLLSKLNCPRVVVVGHSRGGEIAIRVAAAIQQCVIALVIVDFCPEVSAAGTRHAADKFSTLLREYQSHAEFESDFLSWRALATPEQAHHIARNSLRSAENGRLVLKCDPMLAVDNEGKADSNGLWSCLQVITCPTLIVRGAGSALVPRAVVTRMSHVLPRARVIEVRRAGHDVMLDNPHGFSEAVRPFVFECRAKQ